MVAGRSSDGLFDCWVPELAFFNNPQPCVSHLGFLSHKLWHPDTRAHVCEHGFPSYQSIGESSLHLSKEDISSMIVIKKYLVEEVFVFVDN